MTTSLYQDIRGALQVHAATATGFPPLAQRAYENQRANPTTGIPYVRMTLTPTSGRAFSVSAVTKAHRGLFQVDYFFPALVGTADKPSAGDGEPAIDNLKSMFAPGTKLPLTGGETLYIDYAERGPGLAQDGWFCIPVTIGWRCFSARD